MTARVALDLKLAAPDTKADRWGPLFLLGALRPHVRVPMDAKGRRIAKKAVGSLRYAWPIGALTETWTGQAEPVGVLDDEGVALVRNAVYDDLFVGHPMRAFVATHLLTDDARAADLAERIGVIGWVGSAPEMLDWATDVRKDCRPFDPDDEEGIDTIVRGTMGTGYTPMTRPNDGSPAIAEAWVPLADGSALLGWTMLWFNK